MNSNSRKPIAALADDVIALSKQGNRWSQGAGALRFTREFERHSDNPEAFEELVAALEERGGSSVDLILLPLAELAFIPLAVMRQHAVGHGGFHTGAMGEAARASAGFTIVVPLEPRGCDDFPMKSVFWRATRATVNAKSTFCSFRTSIAITSPGLCS